MVILPSLCHQSPVCDNGNELHKGGTVIKTEEDLYCASHVQHHESDKFS
jgi:hypothetical protein